MHKYGAGNQMVKPGLTFYGKSDIFIGLTAELKKEN